MNKMEMIKISGLNSPLRRYRVAEWINTRPGIFYLQEIPLSSKDTHRMKVKGWKKIFLANRNQKRAGVAMVI